MICIIPACGAYGPRINIHSDAPQEVHDFFKAQSLWGGADKTGENYKSYELGNEHEWMKHHSDRFG